MSMEEERQRLLEIRQKAEREWQTALENEREQADLERQRLERSGLMNTPEEIFESTV